MDDVCLVHVLTGSDELDEDHASFGFGVSFPSLEEIHQALSYDQLVDPGLAFDGGERSQAISKLTPLSHNSNIM